ncbi:hypothetical protein RJT34_10596 [Clitoria ternatea]|uniref:Uncharacterized protein n=1 Tax=Clitoria ternatea TaxID=43366 RepID=A0AAN9K945_CLITE
MKKMGFQQQCYADDGMWMETQSQQQQGYAFHEEWSSDNNNYHRQYPAMHMVNKHGGNYGMFHEGMHAHHGGHGKKFPFGGTDNNSHHHHHQLLNGGGVKFSSGGHHEYVSEEAEFEQGYSEEHVGGGMAKVDEMRYEHHNWGGGETRYANPYGMNKFGNTNWRPHGGHHKVQWTAKGV